MINIVGKYTQNGNVMLWRISEDGVEMFIAARLVYSEMYFHSMRECGFKFHDYNMNITMPDGRNINDVPETELFVSNNTIKSCYDVLDRGGLFDERDIVQFFERDINVAFIETEKPTNITINTREELLDYIEACNQARKKGLSVFSPVPVNAFTNPDALFTIEEIAANENNIADIFVRLFFNHEMRCKKDFESVLDRYGVTDLSNTTKAMVDILKGFFKWGIPGIKANIVKMNVNYNPMYSISHPEKTIEATATLKACIRGKKSDTFFCEDSKYPMEYSEDRGLSYVKTRGSFMGTPYEKINVKSVGDKFDAYSYGYVNINPRIEIELLSEDGISATFVADVNEACMFRGYSRLCPTLRMFEYKTPSKYYVPLSRILYYGYNYINDIVRIHSFVDQEFARTAMPPKYKSSFDLYTGIGISPYWAPIYINEVIGDGCATSMEIPNSKEFSNLHAYCSDTVRFGLSSDILEKYGTGEDDFADKPLHEQMEYINEEISNLIEANNYLVAPERDKTKSNVMQSDEYRAWEKEYKENEVSNVNFIFSLLEGIQNIGSLAIGKHVDNQIEKGKIVQIVYAGFNACRRDHGNVSCAEYLTRHISSYFDLDSLFPIRKAAYEGCLKDIKNCVNEFSANASNFVFVTKVFRENANVELSEANRHWGFECINLSKGAGSPMKAAYNMIVREISDSVFRYGTDSDINSIHMHTLNEVVRIIMSNNNPTEKNGAYEYEYKVQLESGKYIIGKYELGVGMVDSLKGMRKEVYYCSCYDFCERQFANAKKCEYFPINASITPWQVIPKGDFTIPEYNLYVNYYTMEQLQSVLPAKIITRIKESGAKVIDSLRDRFERMSLFPAMMPVFSPMECVIKAQEGFFLEFTEYEDLDAYMSRTINEIAKARDLGQAIKNTKLKSDIFYKVFKPFMIYDGCNEDGYSYQAEFSRPATNKYISVCQPRVLTEKWRENLDSTNMLPESVMNSKFQRVDFDDIPFEKKCFNDALCCADFNYDTPTYIYKGAIRYGNESKVIKDLTENDMNELCSKKVAIRIDNESFLVRTITGFVKVVV